MSRLASKSPTDKNDLNTEWQNVLALFNKLKGLLEDCHRSKSSWLEAEMLKNDSRIDFRPDSPKDIYLRSKQYPKNDITIIGIDTYSDQILGSLGLGYDKYIDDSSKTLFTNKDLGTKSAFNKFVSDNANTLNERKQKQDNLYKQHKYLRIDSSERIKENTKTEKNINKKDAEQQTEIETEKEKNHTKHGRSHEVGREDPKQTMDSTPNQQKGLNDNNSGASLDAEQQTEIELKAEKNGRSDKFDSNVSDPLKQKLGSFLLNNKNVSNENQYSDKDKNKPEKIEISKRDAAQQTELELKTENNGRNAKCDSNESDQPKQKLGNLPMNNKKLNNENQVHKDKTQQEKIEITKRDAAKQTELGTNSDTSESDQQKQKLGSFPMNNKNLNNGNQDDKDKTQPEKIEISKQDAAQQTELGLKTENNHRSTKSDTSESNQPKQQLERFPMNNTKLNNGNQDSDKKKKKPDKMEIFVPDAAKQTELEWGLENNDDMDNNIYSSDKIEPNLLRKTSNLEKYLYKEARDDSAELEIGILKVNKFSPYTSLANIMEPEETKQCDVKNKMSENTNEDKKLNINALQLKKELPKEVEEKVIATEKKILVHELFEVDPKPKTKSLSKDESKEKKEEYEPFAQAQRTDNKIFSESRDQNVESPVEKNYRSSLFDFDTSNGKGITSKEDINKGLNMINSSHINYRKPTRSITTNNLIPQNEQQSPAKPNLASTFNTEKSPKSILAEARDVKGKIIGFETLAAREKEAMSEKKLKDDELKKVSKSSDKSDHSKHRKASLLEPSTSRHRSEYFIPGPTVQSKKKLKPPTELRMENTESTEKIIIIKKHNHRVVIEDVFEDELSSSSIDILVNGKTEEKQKSKAKTKEASHENLKDRNFDAFPVLANYSNKYPFYPMNAFLREPSIGDYPYNFLDMSKKSKNIFEPRFFSPCWNSEKYKYIMDTEVRKI